MPASLLDHWPPARLGQALPHPLSSPQTGISPGRETQGGVYSKFSQPGNLSPRWLLIPTPTPSIPSTETRDTTPSKKSSRHGFIQQSLYPMPLWATLCSENLPSPLPTPCVTQSPPWTPPYLGPIPQCQNSSFLICVPCLVQRNSG